MHAPSARPSSLAASGSDPHVESFVHGLRAAGYVGATIQEKQRVATAFVAWLRHEQVPAARIEAVHATAFLHRPGWRSRARRANEGAAVRGFLRHLGGRPGAIPRRTQEGPAPLNIASHYADYLRGQRGLRPRSIEIYLPYVQAFLASQDSREGGFCPDLLDAHAVRDYLLARTRGRSSAYARLVATSLRSFLRFLFLRGATALDLSLAVPTVRRWSRAPVHAFLTPEAVEQVLAVPDRNTPSGRRDYAMLLLLARLGLRAGEVSRLQLDDIRWCPAEIVIRGKGRQVDHLPLVADVGEALADYLQAGRGPTRSRRVFLRDLAPRVGLAGPSAVGHVVRSALARAGVPRPRGYAAHLLRHSLATRMIRQGASLPEIAEILRHRSPATTELYAKVDFETLRGVALGWPDTDAQAHR